VALAPEPVHFEEHLRPVGGVGAARTGGDRHDRVAGVVLAAEQTLQLRVIEALLGERELLGGLARRVGVVRFGRELEQDFGVALGVLDRLQAAELALDRALVAQDLLRALAVVPEIGVGGVRVEPAQPRAQRGFVKAAPGTRRSARAALSRAASAPCGPVVGTGSMRS
jgi:hypothetical protein